MNFSEPAVRTLLHSRRTVYDGYARSDGLFDIEAKLLDTRTHRMSFMVGPDRPAGEPLHQMGLRVTVDADLIIRQVESLIDRGYVSECLDIALAYTQLTGLKIGQGFASAIRALFAGRAGCTHMTEMLIPLATVAMQTVWAQQEVEWQHGGPKPVFYGKPDARPAVMESCYAFRSDGQVMRVRWPKFYTGLEAGVLSHKGDADVPRG